MERDLYLKAKEIFFEVEGVPQEERGDLLRRLCASNEELQAEVESLLAEEESDLLKEPLPEPLLAAALGDPSPGLIGHRLGSFCICALLGEGGMGSVWSAEQDHPRRLVAVKVVRSAIATVEGLRRFRHEVEMLGRLQHPGIAQIYHADTFDLNGQKVPYFAMELVQGARTLDRYVAEVDLDLRARVDLFEKICDAVHHGHQRGIIHRDLKPANVLVDGEGRPKVIDFGVARATDSDVTVTSLHTRVGELVGTLRYMSPEQCESDPGGLDSRSDVYALGVMLYEVLCRQPPYEITDLSIPSAMRVIQQHDPCPPGRLDRRLRGGLEAIVLKSMDKDRERRYGSAAELRADLRRWLEGEPVEARPLSAPQRLIRWAGRRPLLATTIASAIVIILAIGLTLLAIWFIALEPDHIALSPDGRQASLVSRAGKQLYLWDAKVLDGITFAEVVERDSTLGGGRIALVAFRQNAQVGRLAGALCAFDIDHPELPQWTSADVPLVLPLGEPEPPHATFDVQDLIVLDDILPERPGLEIAVGNRLIGHSACAVRVFDLSGRVRYQIWHDGGIYNLAWLPSVGQIVVAALDSELRWDQRSLEQPRPTTGHYPAVVFALKPRDGHLHPERWIHRSERILDETLAWFRWLGPFGPLDGAGVVVSQLNIDHTLGDQARQIEVRFRFQLSRDGGESPTDPELYLLLDEEGDEIKRYNDDGYKRAWGAGELPPDRAFRLLDLADLPPARTGTQATHEGQPR